MLSWRCIEQDYVWSLFHAGLYRSTYFARIFFYTEGCNRILIKTSRNWEFLICNTTACRTSKINKESSPIQRNNSRTIFFIFKCINIFAHFNFAMLISAGYVPTNVCYLRYLFVSLNIKKKLTNKKVLLTYLLCSKKYT